MKRILALCVLAIILVTGSISFSDQAEGYEEHPKPFSEDVSKG